LGAIRISSRGWWSAFLNTLGALGFTDTLSKRNSEDPSWSENGAPLNQVVHHGSSWFIMVHQGSSWFIMVHHGSSWFIISFPIQIAMLQLYLIFG